MRNSLHPNQLRASCDRCRRQKLRCTRTSPQEPFCIRCTRLGHACVTGAQRTIGRPSKRNEALHLQGSPVNVDEDGGDALDAGFHGFTEWFNGTSYDWEMGLDIETGTETSGPTIFDFNSANGSASSLPLCSELPLPGNQNLIYPALDAEFRQLSKINIDLHRLGCNLGRYHGRKDFESFISAGSEESGGFAFLQSLMRAAQQYVVSIRMLRQKLQVGGGGPCHNTTATGELLFILGHENPSSDSLVPGEEMLHGLDSPTAYLIISCFAQLIEYQEFFYNLLRTSSQKTRKGVLGFRDMYIAGVQVLDNPLQGVLIADLLLHTLNQSMVTLGIPSAWTRKGRSPGLCTAPRYRDMLNKELGGVEGPWSTRPAKLAELAVQMKTLMTEACMSESYSNSAAESYFCGPSSTCASAPAALDECSTKLACNY